MKAIRYVLFATALLLFASCGRQPSDIIESSIRAYVNGINKIMESGN